MTYEMDDLRTNGAKNGLCALKGATPESSVGGNTAATLETLGVKKKTNHTLVYPF